MVRDCAFPINRSVNGIYVIRVLSIEDEAVLMAAVSRDQSREMIIDK
jgi:hypothetical protein